MIEHEHGEMRLVLGKFLPPRIAMCLLDVILKPDEAEAAMGDLAEGFVRRGSSAYAVWWYRAQVARLVFEEMMKLLRLYSQARAGR